MTPTNWLWSWGDCIYFAQSLSTSSAAHPVTQDSWRIGTLDFFDSKLIWHDLKAGPLPLRNTVDEKQQARRWVAHDEDLFVAHFRQVHEKLKQGQLNKLVLTAEICAHGSPSLDQWAAMVPTERCDMNRHWYGWWQTVGSASQGGIGCSPELLWEWDGTQISSMALAGTIAADRPDHELINSIKDQHEHRIVIETLMSKLVDFGECVLGPTHVVQAGSLKHLCTNLTVKVSQPPDLTALTLRLHPTGALAGDPTNRALKMLKEFEGSRRHPSFGGIFLIQHPSGVAKAVVMIRNLTWLNNRLSIRCGCGVVKDSSLENERAELNAKWLSVRRMLNL